MVAVVVISAIASAASGQAPRTIHWPRGSSILVRIDASHAPADGPRLVERAMWTWTDAAGGRFTLATAAPKATAAVRVQFLPNEANYGETLPVVDRRTGLIVSADVTINADVAGDAVTRQIVVYLTALHELGHGLGLPHTDVFSDIMYSFRRPDDGERYFGAYRKKLPAAGATGPPPATAPPPPARAPHRP